MVDVVPHSALLPADWRRDPVAAGILLAAATKQLPPPGPPALPPALQRKGESFWPDWPNTTLAVPVNTYGGAAPYGQGFGGDGNVQNSAVFACLSLLSTSFPEPPLRVYQYLPDGEDEKLPRHPLLELFKRPNPHHTTPELWAWTQWAKHSDGNAFWRKVRSGGGTVEEVWPLSPTRVEPITTDPDRRRGVFISYYRYERETGVFEDIPPEDIVHFRLGLDDCDHRRGCSPLKRLVREVATDEETTRFVGALLANFAVPGLLITTQDRTMSEEDANRLKTAISERFSGDARGRVGVLNNGATAAQFGFSPEQMDLKALHRVPEERIAAVLRVPAVLVGLGAGLDRSIYNNAREAREAFTELTLTGSWRQDAARIDLELLPDFDRRPTTFTRFDLTGVRALQEDEDKKYARLNVAVQGKWVKRNEARAEVGLPPVAGWDAADEAPAPVPPQLMGGGEDDEADDGRVPPERRLAPPADEQRALTVLEGKAGTLEAAPALLEAIVALAQPGLQQELSVYLDETRQKLIQAVLRAGANE